MNNILNSHYIMKLMHIWRMEYISNLQELATSIVA
jgi:hypothetical protein